MIIQTKGVKDIIDPDCYKKAVIRTSIDCQIKIHGMGGKRIFKDATKKTFRRKGAVSFGFDNSNIFRLKAGDVFECGGYHGKKFTITPSNKKIKYTIKITDK